MPCVHIVPNVHSDRASCTYWVYQLPALSWKWFGGRRCLLRILSCVRSMPIFLSVQSGVKVFSDIIFSPVCYPYSAWCLEYMASLTFTLTVHPEHIGRTNQCSAEKSHVGSEAGDEYCALSWLRSRPIFPSVQSGLNVLSNIIFSPLFHIERGTQTIYFSEITNLRHSPIQKWFNIVSLIYT